MVEDGNNVTRESVLDLIEKKDTIEKKLNELKQILDSNHVGMTEELVDGDGYPRQDIDVYQVRHARHQIICLKNDHKTLMKQIEEGLHAIHAETSDTIPEAHSNPQRIARHLSPVARVNLVDMGSPAAAAGLAVNDLILEFGSVNSSNFKSLQDIGSLVQHSIGRNIPITVTRNGIDVRVMLTPHEWQGRGFLGCNIVPIEYIER